MNMLRKIINFYSPTKEKSEYDENFWYINGEKYDLNDFVDNHPGGTTAILLGKGRDCTNLFDSYHIMNDNHLTVLKKYGKVVDKKNELHEDIKKMVRNMGESHKITWRFSFILFILFCGILVGAYGLSKGYYWALIVMPIFSWLFGVNIAHDASHFAISHNPSINFIISLFSVPAYNTIFWYYQHVLQHHSYTNDYGHDVDLQHLEPFARFAPTADYYRWMKLQHISILVTGSFTAFVLSIIIPLLGIVNDRLVYKNCHNKHILVHKYKLIIIIQLIEMMVIIIGPFFKFTLGKAILFAVVPHMIFSLIFFTLTQISHIQKECSNITNKDFIEQMILTSTDYNVTSEFMRIMTGGLNCQALHHCLPGVSSSHYHKLYPEFIEICRKHGIEPKVKKNLWTVLIEYMKHIKNLGKPDNLNN